MTRYSLLPAVAVMTLALPMWGCAPGADLATPADSYREPGWMAEARMTIEREGLETQRCMAERGWTVELDADGSLSTVGLTEGQEAEHEAARRECFTLVLGTLPERTAQDWSVKYDHALDTAACLEAAGYDVPEPPSRDAWVDAAMNHAELWAPFDALNYVDIDAEAYFELFDRCPQDGPTVTLNFS